VARVFLAASPLPFEVGCKGNGFFFPTKQQAEIFSVVVRAKRFRLKRAAKVTLFFIFPTSRDNFFSVAS